MELHGCHYLINDPIPVRYTPKTKYSRATGFDTSHSMRITSNTPGLLWGILDQWYGPSYLMINFEGVWGSAHIELRYAEDIEAQDEEATLRLQKSIDATKARRNEEKNTRKA